MPQGKGTYGSKVGRPPRKKYEGGGMTAEERRRTNESLLMKSIKAQIDREEKNYPQKELDRSRNNLIKNASSMWSKNEIEGYLEEERNRRFEERRETAIEGNPLLEKRQIRNEGGPSILAQGANTAYDMAVAKHNPMTAVHGIATTLDSRIDNPTLDKVIDPLVNVTSALNNVTEGILNAPRTVFKAIKDKAIKDRKSRRSRGEEQAEREQEALADKASRKDRADGGSIDDQMSMLMEGEETHTMPDGTVMPGATHEEYEQMLPDEEMEEDYVDYVMQETLSNEDRNYLIDALEKDDRLSMIFDQVVESATEFSGSGPIEGPGNEKSDSIPARLSDGEFVITAKATEEIGADNLMSMMKDAEAAADERQSVAYGGMIDEEDQAVPLPTQGSRAALGNVPNVVKQSRQVEEEMLKSSPRRYYVPVSG